ncbi:MAG: hypothetical protein M1541_10460 [Acidobacteria bacterium]|nr:hypothetical protein [Acidobacteriota bacterium]
MAFFLFLYLGYYTPTRYVPTVPSAGALPAGQPGIEWFQTLNPEGGLSLVGREFELTKTKVLDVAGDTGFWIGPTQPPQNPRQEGLKLFVLRGRTQTALRPGEDISITGVIERLPADPQAAWHLDAKTAAQLAPQKVYLLANRIAPAVE